MLANNCKFITYSTSPYSSVLACSCTDDYGNCDFSHTILSVRPFEDLSVLLQEYFKTQPRNIVREECDHVLKIKDTCVTEQGEDGREYYKYHVGGSTGVLESLVFFDKGSTIFTDVPDIDFVPEFVPELFGTLNSPCDYDETVIPEDEWESFYSLIMPSSHISG